MIPESILLFGSVAFLGWGIGHIVHRAGRIPEYLIQ